MMHSYHSRRGKTQKNQHKTKSHSRVLLSGIPTALNNAQGRDPRLQASGVTTNLNNPPSSAPTGHLPPHGEAANFNAPSTWREGAVPEGRNPGVAEGRVRGIFKEEALNKNDFRAPLRSGFTLIELLVVVLIIGILAAVALPHYQKAVERSQAVEGFVKLKTLAASLEMYYLQNGSYPAWGGTLDEIDIQFPDSTQWHVYWNNGYLGLQHNKPKYQLAFIPFHADSSARGRISCDIQQTDEAKNTLGVRICKMLCNTTSLITIWGHGTKGCIIHQ